MRVRLLRRLRFFFAQQDDEFGVFAQIEQELRSSNMDSTNQMSAPSFAYVVSAFTTYLIGNSPCCGRSFIRAAVVARMAETLVVACAPSPMRMLEG